MSEPANWSNSFEAFRKVALSFALVRKELDDPKSDLSDRDKAIIRQIRERGKDVKRVNFAEGIKIVCQGIQTEEINALIEKIQKRVNVPNAIAFSRAMEARQVTGETPLVVITPVSGRPVLACLGSSSPKIVTPKNLHDVEPGSAKKFNEPAPWKVPLAVKTGPDGVDQLAPDPYPASVTLLKERIEIQMKTNSSAEGFS